MAARAVYRERKNYLEGSFHSLIHLLIYTYIYTHTHTHEPIQTQKRRGSVILSLKVYVSDYRFCYSFVRY
jgi:hypothetical protein